MARTPRSKRLSTQEKPKAAASSSEDEVGSGKESSEEPPQTKKVAAPSAAQKKQSKKPPSAAPSAAPHPSSESDRPPQVVSKPIASEPVDDESKKKKKKKNARSKSTAHVPSTPTNKSTGKRPAENTGGEVKESSRAAKKLKRADADGDAAEKKKGAEAEGNKKEAGEESSRRPLFQRVWSDADEIVILEGLGDLVKKGVVDPPSNVEAFLKSIKKSLSIPAVKSQLADKIRRLKKRYMNNATKGKNGAGRNFSNPQEQKVFNLSKPVWGGMVNSGGGGGLAPPPPPPHNVEKEVEILLRIFRGVGQLDEGFVRRGLTLLDPATRTDLVRKYRKLEFDALKLRLCETSLLKKQLKLSVKGHEKEFT